jgi:ABC-type amino acid transport substrate-binding protein
LTTSQGTAPSPAEAALRALAPHGVMRAAINLGNSVLAQKAHLTGDLAGVSVELAKALGVRLGVAVQLVEYTAAGQVVEALKAGSWDLAFLAVDPARSVDIVFTPPYVLIEGAYLVRDASPITVPADVDSRGIRVATGAGSAYDLFLARTLKHATIERSSTAREALELMAQEERDVAAGVRAVLERFALQHGGLRLLQPSFMVIEQAIAIPRSAVHAEGAARYLTEFIEEMKRNGFVADALAASGQSDSAVAPAATGPVPTSTTWRASSKA